MAIAANAGGRLKRSKYGNKKVVIDVITFDSQAEGRRYQELKLLELAREIYNLRIHPKYEIRLEEGAAGFVYEGDFEYWDKNDSCVCEDVKGYRTDIYKLKIKCARAAYPYINFVEVSCHSRKR